VNSSDGKRLERWRETLPRASNAPISATSLSRCLGWAPTRWTQLEKKATWSLHHRAEVERGLRGVCDRLDVDMTTADRVVAHVLDGAPAPQLGAWRDGLCPAAPMGRPLGSGRARSREREDDEMPERPILPEPVRRSQTEAILRHVAKGVLDVDAALRAIIDVFDPLLHYYNKTPGPDARLA
jgi:hypothetical protein